MRKVSIKYLRYKFNMLGRWHCVLLCVPYARRGRVRTRFGRLCGHPRHLLVITPENWRLATPMKHVYPDQTAIKAPIFDTH